MACGGLQGVPLVDLCHIEDPEEKQFPTPAVGSGQRDTLTRGIC